MTDCDCGHPFEAHHHGSGLQYCKECDCKSAGITEMTPLQFGEEKRSNKGLIITGVILAIVFSVFVIGLTNPILIIGMIWDFDIKDQLLKANQAGLEHKPDLTITLNDEIQEIRQVKMRFTYVEFKNNPEEVDIRVERAIQVFNNLFSDPDKTATVKIVENEKTVEFVWKPEVRN